MKKLPLVLAALALVVLLISQFYQRTPSLAPAKATPRVLVEAKPPAETAKKPSAGATSLPESSSVVSAMQVVISIGGLVAGLFVVLSQSYKPEDKHWAFGLIGTVVGFWLKM